MANLNIDNVITVEVSQPGAGIGEYNTSNVALFTQEAFNPTDFGSLGYKLYLDPTDVATDFGTTSITYQQANALFSQQPNILLGGGYLAVIPLIVEVQNILFSGIPVTGSFNIVIGAQTSDSIAFSDTAAQVQAALNDQPGLEGVTVTGAIDNITGLTITYFGFHGVQPLLTVINNTLGVTTTITEVTPGETLDAAIARTTSLVEYFGIISAYILGQTEALAAAAVVQPLNLMLFVVEKDPATVAPGGLLDLIRTGDFDQTRGLFYGSTDDLSALLMMAAYVGRGLSVNFTGSDTTITMHLKDLIGIQPDPSMTQTLLNECQTAGADVYASFQGVAKVFCSNGNDFFDNVYNLLSFVGAIKVAGFNVLAETSTKIVQTENGVSTLKDGFRQVCVEYVNNQFLAPGTWTSPNTFGNQADFYANISQQGYYIYSTPIAQQNPVDRANRLSPLIQIAVKYAGAIHKASVIVNINV